MAVCSAGMKDQQANSQALTEITLEGAVEWPELIWGLGGCSTVVGK
jgi:hypothetical protein